MKRKASLLRGRRFVVSLFFFGTVLVNGGFCGHVTLNEMPAQCDRSLHDDASGAQHLKRITFFEESGFTRIVIGRTVNPVNPSPVDCTEEDFAERARQDKEEIIPWVLGKLAAGETPKYFPYSHFFQQMEKGERCTAVSPFKCGACRGTTTVGADGILYPCHRFVGMKNWRIGDIANGPDIEKCKQFWRDYRASTSEHCGSCWIWLQCKGPCPWEIAQADGTFSAPRHCEFIKDHMAESAYVYSEKAARSNGKEIPAYCGRKG